jgi:MoxR-like ATPase
VKAIARQEWALVMEVLDCIWIRTVFIYGPPGTGKTYAGLHIGRVGQGVYCVTLTVETSAAELRGHFIFKGGEAVWHDGPFVRAMREGKRLVINELTNASADVLALLFPILESPETAELTLPSGETVRPAPGFHVVATDNYAPDRLPGPLQDRFVAFLRVTQPHPDALAELADDLRELAESTERITDDRYMSARVWRNLHLLTPLFGLKTACLLVLGPERGQMVFDAIQLALATKKKKDRKKD